MAPLVDGAVGTSDTGEIGLSGEEIGGSTSMSSGFVTNVVLVADEVEAGTSEDGGSVGNATICMPHSAFALDLTAGTVTGKIIHLPARLEVRPG